jgi:uncharacterized protein (DUF2235 family)
MLHIFLFDGTCNGDDDEFGTNIRLIRDLTMGFHGQPVYYYEGPGNDEDDFIDKWFGSSMGVGHRSIRDEAFDTLLPNYAGVDKIVVFGFSRGAAIARMFCGKLAENGIGTDFLGCFDTVAAFLPFGRFQQDPLFGSLDVSMFVNHARHAVAFDEDRAAFAPRLMNARANVIEMWFTGNHSDVGGGYEDRGLADRTLAWMLTEAYTIVPIKFRTPPTPQERNDAHREDLPLLRKVREPVVLIAGEVSSLPANLSGVRPMAKRS